MKKTEVMEDPSTGVHDGERSTSFFHMHWSLQNSNPGTREGSNSWRRGGRCPRCYFTGRVLSVLVYEGYE